MRNAAGSELTATGWLLRRRRGFARRASPGYSHARIIASAPTDASLFDSRWQLFPRLIHGSMNTLREAPWSAACGSAAFQGASRNTGRCLCQETSAGLEP